MNSNINLIGHKDHISVPTASRRLRIMRGVAILLLFGISSAAVTLYILISFSPLPQVQEQEREALLTISRSHPEMARIALLQDRVAGVDQILKQRNSYDVMLASVMSKMPIGIKIYQISMSKKEVTITVKSNSLESLNTFIENLITAAKNKEYANITLNSILSDNLSKNFSLTVTVNLL